MNRTAGRSAHLLDRHGRKLALSAGLLLYLLLSTYQLGLPGIHYDEAGEAGVNAMELLAGTPVSAFRDVTFPLFGLQLPVMVQDYIGALNVYLAMPLLALTGVGVPNLRFLGILTGLAALLLLERAVSEWVASFAGGRKAFAEGPARSGAPISLAGLITLFLLAASPSFIFWSRQGIFVTNLMLPLVFWSLWQGVRWLRTGRTNAFVQAALGAGLALYAKLLAIWILAPFFLLVIWWWFAHRRKDGVYTPPLSPGVIFGGAIAFLLPLLPFIYFNLQSGGTVDGVLGNLGRSYYGVDNRDVLTNLSLRWGQLLQSLRGDQFWYLGGPYGNLLAPFFALAFFVGAAFRRYCMVTPPALLAVAAFVSSLVTISDLFITHYALLQPIVMAVIGLSAAILLAPAQEESAATADGERPTSRFTVAATTALLVIWVVLDLSASLRYHRALAATGGLGDHTDASYQLAYHLRYGGLGAPIALDWGLDAPVRFLSQGAVTPIEIFGYESPSAPAADFSARLDLFLPNPDNVYLLHTADMTSFAGRREAFFAQVAERQLTPVLEETFLQRDGTPYVELWRVVP